MRPIKLRIAAFGPFPGTEVIDFEALAPRGLFVVSGETGTGKTTIFDAMCWALYGEMPKKESHTVRSDHVDEHVRTEVEFTFEAGGERYVVTRNPEQQRPATRGGRLVKDPAGATLVRITATSTESLTTKASEAKSLCEKLIGLDADQFMRVVLLPQGDFDAFLLAKSQEREALLTTLFGTEVFERIVTELKAERERLSNELGSTDNQIELTLGMARNDLARVLEALEIEHTDDLDSADRDTVAALMASLETPITELTVKSNGLEDQARSAAAAAEEVRILAERFDRANELRGRLADIEARRPKVEADRVAAEASRGARPVAAAAAALEDTQDRSVRASTERDDALEGIRSAFESVGVTIDATDISSFATRLSELDKLNGRQADALEAATQATAALASARQDEKQCQAEVDRCSKDLEVANATKKSIEADLPGPDESTPDLGKIRESIESCKVALQRRKQLDATLPEAAETARLAANAAEHYEEKLSDYVKTTAPRLAGTLEDNAPCPVCGSREHPSPAIASERTPTTIEEVQQAGESRDELTSRSKALETKLAALNAELGADATTSRDALEVRLEEFRAALDSAETTVKRIRDLHEEHEAAAKEVDRLDKSLAALKADLAITTDRRQTKEQHAEQAAASTEGIDPQDVNRTTGVLRELEIQINELDPLFGKASAAQGEVTSARSRLEEVLETSPFDSVEAALGSLLPADEEQSFLDAADKLRDDHTKAASGLDEIDAQGVPETRPDVDSLSRRSRELSERAAHERSRLDRARDNLEHAHRALADHDGLVSGSSGLREQVDRLRLAHKVCNEGGRGIDMPLKRWVLTRELDRVTDAANIHLDHMTNHRYKLQRRQARQDGRRSFGLDLEVMDATTGRPRPTTSLSGGEQFQASLSLALGLADVVSRGGTASGKRFDALFVDEGFGSLSAECLDDAIETLHQLQASGRMVGAITHVETMKQRLHVGIEVRRRQDGNGSTLTVYP